MLNVIKMDLYRMCRSKSLRIGLVVAAIICFGAVALSAGLLALVNIAIDAEPEMAEGMDAMVAVFPFLGWNGGVDMAVIVQTFSGVFCLAIATILSAIYVNEEQTFNYGKNYLGQLSDKGLSVVSKMIVTSLINMILVLVYTLVSAGGALLFFGNKITGFDAGKLASVLLLRLAMYLAINAIIVFLSLLTKSRSAAMIVGVIFGVGASDILYSGMTYGAGFVISHVFPNSTWEVPALSELMPDGVQRMIDMSNLDGDLIARVLVLAPLYIAVFTLASFFLVRKRDVR